MKFKMCYASTWTGCSQDGFEVEVNTLEDLQKIQEDAGDELIVDFKRKRIMVYDDYIE